MLGRILFAVVALGCGGGGSDPQTDGGTGDGGATGKRIFVTAGDFPAGFASGQPLGTDGAVMADMQCQSAAQGAGLSGGYKAWLSRLGRDSLPPRTAPERIVGDGPWHLVGTNELVFLNRSALANTPRVPINRNELGVLVATGPVWTGTMIGGTHASSDCEGWWSSNSGNQGTVGRLESMGSDWTNSGTTQACGTRARLYCLEM